MTKVYPGCFHLIFTEISRSKITCIPDKHASKNMKEMLC